MSAEGKRVMAFRWISMFSGAGGDLGFQSRTQDAGIENDKQQQESCQLSDAPYFQTSRKPDADGVLYSFPCQIFP